MDYNYKGLPDEYFQQEAIPVRQQDGTVLYQAGRLTPHELSDMYVKLLKDFSELKVRVAELEKWKKYQGSTTRVLK